MIRGSLTISNEVKPGRWRKRKEEDDDSDTIRPTSLHGDFSKALFSTDVPKFPSQMDTMTGLPNTEGL